MDRIDWTVEFFEGDNEERLLASSLNTIEIEELPQFVRVLRDFVASGGNGEISVQNIEITGQDDAVIVCARAGERLEFEICSETTFQDMLDMLS